MMKYTLERESKNLKEGTWNVNDVKIFDADKNLVFKYRRNYSNFTEETFAPFENNGVWYALYSSDYQKTSVVNLTTGEHWCDEPNPGFCPTEFWVPSYELWRHEDKDDSRIFTYAEYDNTEKDGSFENDDEYVLAGTYFKPYGFVAGCYWGDDSSWKIRFIDLTNVNKKIITNENKFGHFELPRGGGLKDNIKFFEDEGIDRFYMNQQRCFDLKDDSFFD